jgi:hypothetical protein
MRSEDAMSIISLFGNIELFPLDGWLINRYKQAKLPIFISVQTCKISEV